jgi:hypothetical protein
VWPTSTLAQYATAGIEPCPVEGHLLDCSEGACGLGAFLATQDIPVVPSGTSPMEVLTDLAGTACTQAAARERDDALETLAELRATVSGYVATQDLDTTTAGAIAEEIALAEAEVERLPTADLTGTWLGVVPILQGGGYA